MASAYNFLIAANDEHGLNPPTEGKRTPIMPNLGRSFYENEINRQAKQYFLLACARCGFRTLDVKPELTDTAVATRVRRVNSAGATLLVTFAYNAYGDGATFNNVNGYIVFYSRSSYRPTQSRLLAYDISAGLSKTLFTKNLGVGTLLDVGVLQSVRCPSVLCECGFMTNLAEAKLMLDPDFARDIGEGACRGVCEFLNVNFVERTGTYPTVRRGNRNKYVRVLQYALSFMGYNVGAKDGAFGAQTQDALKRFQRDNGLVDDGIAGAKTWAVINRTAPNPTLRKGAKGEWVKYLQRKLTSKLYPLGNVDGIFGNATENAVRAFQRENGLTPDGIVGKNTWALLSRQGGGRQG